MSESSIKPAVKVLVETVVPLTEAEKTKLQTILADKVSKAYLTERVNPLLIGGIKLSFRGKVLDYSLKARLNNIQKGLLQNAET